MKTFKKQAEALAGRDKPRDAGGLWEGDWWTEQGLSEGALLGAGCRGRQSPAACRRVGDEGLAGAVEMSPETLWEKHW